MHNSSTLLSLLLMHMAFFSTASHAVLTHKMQGGESTSHSQSPSDTAEGESTSHSKPHSDTAEGESASHSQSPSDTAETELEDLDVAATIQEKDLTKELRSSVPDRVEFPHSYDSGVGGSDFSDSAED